MYVAGIASNIDPPFTAHRAFHMNQAQDCPMAKGTNARPHCPGAGPNRACTGLFGLLRRHGVRAERPLKIAAGSQDTNREILDTFGKVLIGNRLRSIA